MNAESDFLRYSCKKLEQMRERIGACVALLTPEQIWMRGGETQNAVGNLLLHLNGNLQQWILAGIGGIPVQRDRDAEFAARAGELPALSETVAATVNVIRNLPHERLTQRATIQKYDVTVLEAIYHVVEHFSEHTGQIILLTKAYTNRDLGFYSHLSGKALPNPEPRP